jgi:hypothetical protein
MAVVNILSAQFCDIGGPESKGANRRRLPSLYFKLVVAVFANLAGFNPNTSQWR